MPRWTVDKYQEDIVRWWRAWTDSYIERSIRTEIVKINKAEQNRQEAESALAAPEKDHHDVAQ
jgi:murein L,D-transpeptidase YafK